MPVIHPTISLITPTPDMWDAANPPEIRFVLSGYYIDTGPESVTVTIDAFVYDSPTSVDPRTERVMEYRQDDTGLGIISGGPAPITFGEALGSGSVVGEDSARYILLLGDNWEGSYEVRLNGFTGHIGKWGVGLKPTGVHGLGVLRRKSPLVQGTPISVQFSEIATLKYYYAWWFGVGSRESWYWPRDLESVKFVGQRMPEPFNRLFSTLQVDNRNDDYGIPRYKLVDRFTGIGSQTASGKIVTSAIITQPVVQSLGRREPPEFRTGVI